MSDPTASMRVTIDQLSLNELDDIGALVDMVDRAEFVILTHSERGGTQHIDPLMRCTLTDEDREILEGLGIQTDKAIFNFYLKDIELILNAVEGKLKKNVKHAGAMLCACELKSLLRQERDPRAKEALTRELLVVKDYLDELNRPEVPRIV